MFHTNFHQNHHHHQSVKVMVTGVLVVLSLLTTHTTTSAFSTRILTKPIIAHSHNTIEEYNSKAVVTSNIHHHLDGELLTAPGRRIGRQQQQKRSSSSSSFDYYNVKSRTRSIDVVTKGRGPVQNVLNKVCKVLKIDLDRMAQAGISFAISYSTISNINGALSLSLSWYLASKKTGLSPLAPGQWKSLLAAYGGLYAIITLLRPIRVMGAAALSKKTTQWMDTIQRRMSCSQPTAAIVLYALGLGLQVITLTCGISLASTCSGVPLW